MATTLIKKMAIAIAMTLSTTTAALAQTTIPTPGRIDAPRSGSFTCAPYLATFEVKPLDRRQGTGIRCIKMSEGTTGNRRIPKLAWYGEGNWNGKTYRHVGHAFYQGANLLGAAADFREAIHNNFPFGNLKLELVDANTIRVTGAWNEVWTRVDKAAYNPLPRPTACGRYFDQYKASDLLPGARLGEGLRCALRSEHIPSELREPRLPLVKGMTTWFGNGYWGNSRNTYSHLGTFSANGYGASDICDRPFGPVCNAFGWGSLRLRAVAGGYEATGAWRERWSR